MLTILDSLNLGFFLVIGYICDNMISSSKSLTSKYFSELLSIDPDFIKDELKNDELLIYERGLKPILAKKCYFFEDEEWKNI